MTERSSLQPGGIPGIPPAASFTRTAHAVPDRSAMGIGGLPAIPGVPFDRGTTPRITIDVVVTPPGVIAPRVVTVPVPTLGIDVIAPTPILGDRISVPAPTLSVNVIPPTVGLTTQATAGSTTVDVVVTAPTPGLSATVIAAPVNTIDVDVIAPAATRGPTTAPVNTVDVDVIPPVLVLGEVAQTPLATTVDVVAIAPIPLLDGKTEHFAIYNAATGNLLTITAHNARDIDASVLGRLLGEGLWSLTMTRVDQYGSESPVASIKIKIDALGNMTTDLRRVSDVRAVPKVGGLIHLSWLVEPFKPWMRDPVNYEIEDQSTGSIIATVSHTGSSTHETDVGPFTDGTTVRLWIRTADATDASPWFSVPAVVADALGPAPPSIIV